MFRWFTRSASIRANSNRKSTSHRLNRLRNNLWVTNLEDRLAPAVITVTDIGDTVAVDGKVTLREALQSANGNANINADVVGVGAYGIDTIQFDSVLFSTPQIITNTAEQLVSDSVSIVGTSAANVTIDGNMIDRVFHVEKTGSQIVVTFKNMTIQNGKATTSLVGGKDGGGIYNNDEDVTIDSCVLTANSGEEGGGVSANVQGAKLTIINSTITGNNATASDGGGVNTEAAGFTLTITNSTIAGNTALDDGGGVYSTGFGNWDIQGSTISGNKSFGNAGLLGGGGGLYWYGSVNTKALILNSTIANNDAADDGGGLCLNLSGNLLIQNSTIAGNSAGSGGTNVGGGIAVEAGRNTLTIQSSVITANNDSEAPDIWSGMSVTVSNSAIGSRTGFAITDAGGNVPFGAALFLDPAKLGSNGGPTMTILPDPGSPLRNHGANPSGATTDQAGNSRVLGGTADIGALESVDATGIPTGLASLPDQTKSGTTTYVVTVVYTDDVSIDALSIGVSDVTLAGSGVSNPNPISFTASPSGPVVTATYTFVAPDNVGIGQWDVSDNGTFTVTLAANEVSDTSSNFIPNGDLGQFRGAITQTFKVTNANDSGAGSLREALQFASASPNTLDTITFDPAFFSTPQTIAWMAGPELVTDAVTITGTSAANVIINGTGSNNRFVELNGVGPVAFTLSNVTITGMKRLGAVNATDRGGVILSNDDPVTLTNCVFTGNSAENDGGVVAMYGGNILTVTNCSVTSNTAIGPVAGADGGAFYVQRGATLNIVNSNISGNSSFFSGGAIYARNSKLTISNSTISGNVNTGTSLTYAGGGGIYFRNADSSELTISNTTISDNLTKFNGGGILVRGANAYMTINIKNSTIASNRSLFTNILVGNSGGGFSGTDSGGATINIESSIFAGNLSGNASAAELAVLAGTKISAKNSALGASITKGGATLVDLGGNLIGATINLGTNGSNGGTVPTRLPAFGSPLINVGSNPDLLTNDARGAGFPRSVGGGVDIGATESGSEPVALVNSFSDVLSGGGTSFDFSVTYVDDVGMSTVTMDGGDFTVTSPTGATIPVSVKTGPAAGNGSPRTVTYTFTPPGGSWDGADNGIYRVNLVSNQVSDTGGKFVGGGMVGFLRVAIPATLVVNTNLIDETTDTDGKLSLREAIAAANSNPGTDTISFDPTIFKSTITPGVPDAIISLTLGRIQISDDLVIVGLGTDKVAIDGASNAGNRLLTINNGATGSHLIVDISKIAFQNTATTSAAAANDSTARGGAILVNDEFVTLTDCSFTNNSSITSGGAIAMNVQAGKLTVVRCTFTGNQQTTAGDATAAGGAIRCTTNVDLVVTDSTFTGNKVRNSGGAIGASGAGVLISNSTFVNNEAGTAADTTSSFGGALFFNATPAQSGIFVRNSTFTGNLSRGRGGAIFSNAIGGVMNVQNCTITGNTSAAFQDGVNAVGGGGGGIGSQYTNIVRVENSIIVGNITNNLLLTPNEISTVTNGTLQLVNCAVGPLPSVIAGSLFDLGGNLFGSTTTTLNLQPLANNGGLTKTIAIAAPSTAIDAGFVSAGATKDQAGQTRVVGTRADIGAFELQTAQDLPTAALSLPSDVTTGGATTFDVSVTYTDKTGVDGMTIDVNDITVKGGFFGVTPVSPTSVTTTGSGSSITAKYTFAAPNGVFANNTNGVYTVTLKGGQVADTSANSVFAADTDFGNFRSVIGKNINVTSGGDAGAGTLRQAIIDANASLGIDTITFSVPTVTMTAAPTTIVEGIFFQGNGAGSTTITQTNAAARVFNIVAQGQAPVTFDGLTISGGKGVAGAAINFADEAVTISNCVITGNTATGNGNISANEGGNLTVTNSTLNANSATGLGGAIFVNRNLSNVIVQNTTISGNTGTNGGGIYINYGGSLQVLSSTISGNSANTGGPATGNGGGGINFGSKAAGAGLVIRNSTISNNTSSSHGGGILIGTSFQGTALIQNSTITQNVSNASSNAQGNTGGGLTWRLSAIGFLSNFATVQLDSNIIAGNTSTSGGGADISTQNNISFAKNLIGIGDTGFLLNDLDNLKGTKASPLNPLLVGTTPVNNGGPTATFALQAGSPALNAGFNPAGLANDQRGLGFARVSGGSADIGAFETQVAVTAAKVTNVKINSLKSGADQTQRSRVTDVAITFDSPVSFVGSPAAAFTLNKVGGGSVTLSASVDVTNTIVTLTFIGGSVDNLSLADGRYALHALAAQFAGGGLDGDSNGTGGDDFIFDEPASPTTLDTAKIFRLFGDYNADGTVAANDFIQFRLALGGSSFAFDFDNDGAVAASDFIQFRLRFGGSI